MKADKNTNADQFLNELLARLNVEAGRLALNHLKIYSNNKLFDICDYKQFITMGSQLAKINIAIIQNQRHITDRKEQLELIRTYHDNPIFGGHIGKKRMHSKLRQHFIRKNMVRDVAQHVDT